MAEKAEKEVEKKAVEEVEGKEGVSEAVKEEKPKKVKISKVFKGLMTAIMLVVILNILSALYGRRAEARPQPQAMKLTWDVDYAYVSEEPKKLYRNPVNLVMKGSMTTPRVLWVTEIGRETPSTDLYVGDVDGDGMSEVVSNHGNNLVIIKNGQVSSVQLSYSPAYHYIDVAGLYDVNGDGRKEILLLLWSADEKIGFAIVDHQGNIIVEKTNLKSEIRGVYDVVLTKVGDAQAVIFLHDSGVSAYTLDGQAIYDVELWISAYGFTRLAIGDINGDGLDELVFPSGGGVYALRLSDGQQLFYKFLGYDIVAVSLGDVDGDGVPEIVTGGIMDDTGKEEWVVLKGNTIYWRAESMGGYTQEYPVIIEDVDGDGDKEVITYESTYLVCRSNTGEVKWYIELGDWVHRSACAGDLNNDGKLEIVAMTYDTFFIVRGDGVVLYSDVIEDGNGYYSLDGVSPVIDDVDGDGRLELVIDYEVFDSQTSTTYYKAVAYD